MTDVASAFAHGVAAGDPTSTSIAIWTAVPVVEDSELTWQVSSDASFENVVASGAVALVDGTERDDADLVAGARPFTVRVDGLADASDYHYRFEVGGETSPVGHCATLPAADADVDHIRLGLACCARLSSGSLVAYGHLADTDPDLVVHLGDYIYEDANPPHHPPVECSEAGEYRTRYAQYRTRPPVQRLHRETTWVTLWDDHEVADDSWRSGSAGESPSGRREWERRRTAAESAYLDWMPQEASTSGPTPMDRHLRIGRLADVVVLDARNAARDRPVSESGPALVAPDDARRIISEEQWEWLAERVEQCDGWLILCSQTQFAPLNLARLPNPKRRLRIDPLVNPGQWDGYPAERRRLGEVLAPVAGRVLLCSGDLHGRFHASFATDETRDDAPSFPEITTPSIRSTPFADAVRTKLPVPAALLDRWLRFLNPHMTFTDLEGYGSTVLDVQHDRLDVTAVDEHGHRRTWRLDRDDPVIRPVDTAV